MKKIPCALTFDKPKLEKSTVSFMPYPLNYHVFDHGNYLGCIHRYNGRRWIAIPAKGDAAYFNTRKEGLDWLQQVFN